jgi:hypothetical protein
MRQRRNQQEAGSKHNFMLVSCFAQSLIMKMKAIYSSETSVDFQQTTRRYIPEDTTVLLPL